jgi:putative redox protein
LGDSLDYNDRAFLEAEMQVELNWTHGMTFAGRGGNSGFKLDVSADADVGGAEDGFRPMELMGLSLGSCTAIDVLSILQKKRQEVTGLQINVETKRREEHPRVWTHVMIEYVVTGNNVDPVAVERAIQLSSEKYCPAQGMLKQAVKIESRYKINAA